jgi:hypothetical protein
MLYWQHPENKMAKAMSFASLTEAFAVAMEQWRGQHRVC